MIKNMHHLKMVTLSTCFFLGGNIALATEAPAYDNVEEIIVVESYKSNKISLGQGFETIREIPQTVSVITSQLIEDQNMLTLNDAMKVATGVTVKSYGSGTSRFLMRGFEINGISIDGMRTFGTSASGTHGHGAPDLFFYEQVEIMRGPAGMLEGSGEPGGYINLARKKAQEEIAIRFKGYANSLPGFRAELDATGALSSDGRLRGRVALGYQDSDSHIDEVDGTRKLFYSTLEYDVSDSLKLAIGASIDDEEIVPDVGVPVNNDGTFADIDRNIYTGTPFNFKNSKLAQQFLEARYEFNSGAIIALTLKNSDRDFEYLLNYTTLALTPGSGVTSRWALNTEQKLNEKSYDLHADIPFTLLGQEHTILVGINGRDEGNYSSGYALDLAYPSIDVFNPGAANNPDPTDTLVQFRGPSTTDTEENGVYIKSILGIGDSSKLILGGRLTRKWNTDNGTSSSEIENEFTPYLGLVHEFNETINAYFSITESFVPNTATDVNNNILDPRTGRQYEIGIKGELNGGVSNYHIAAFKITEDNRVIEDLNNPGFSVAGGEVRAQGFEAEISGNVLDNLQILAGYVYTDTEVVKSDDPTEEGTRFSSDSPKHSLKIWGTYNLNEKFTVGLGLEYASGLYAESGGVRWEQGGYAIFSMMASYQLSENTQFILNGINLSDKEYYSRVQGGGRQNYFGDPRQFKLSVEHKF